MERLSGGRTWWAHLKFTRMNITPTILRKKIEDVREADATLGNAMAFCRHRDCEPSVVPDPRLVRNQTRPSNEATSA
jgi:hypothetical protein